MGAKTPNTFGIGREGDTIFGSGRILLAQASRGKPQGLAKGCSSEPSCVSSE